MGQFVDLSEKEMSQKDNYVFLEVGREWLSGWERELLHGHLPFYKRKMFLDE